MKKSVLVTGSARGNGLAICKKLISEGYKIIGVDKLEQNINLDKNFQILKCDLSSTSDISNLIKFIKTTEIYGLVNNAGIALNESHENYYDLTMLVNCKVPYLLSEAFFKACTNKNKKEAIVVNILSMSSWLGSSFNVAYQMSKSALLGYTRYAAVKYSKYGFRCNSVSPGYIETEMTKISRNSSDRYSYICSRIPKGEWGRSEDVAEAVSFLFGTKSNYINGSDIAVDGGMRSFGL